MSILNLSRQSVVTLLFLFYFFFVINTHSPAVLFLSHPAAIWEADHGLGCRTFFFFFSVRKNLSSMYFQEAKKEHGREYE